MSYMEPTPLLQDIFFKGIHKECLKTTALWNALVFTDRFRQYSYDLYQCAIFTY